MHAVPDAMVWGRKGCRLEEVARLYELRDGDVLVETPDGAAAALREAFHLIVENAELAAAEDGEERDFWAMGYRRGPAMRAAERLAKALRKATSREQRR